MQVVERIKRTWTKGISIESDISIEIWDSGSHKYERWPDGDVCWKVISRELTSTGFSEILEKMPEWFAPGQVLDWVRVPLLLQGPSQYTLGQWSVAVENPVQAQAQAQAKRQQKTQQKPQAQAKPLPQQKLQQKPQAKPLENSEKMGARGGRMQAPLGHMRHGAQMGACAKVTPLREPEQKMKVQIQPQKLQQLQGHPPKSLPRLINQK